jgi:hypothetical protein
MAVVEALIVNTAERPGLQGGDVFSTPNVIDSITGGEYSRMGLQLDRLELWLKVSIVASCVAGIAGLAILFRRR